MDQSNECLCLAAGKVTSPEYISWSIPLCPTPPASVNPSQAILWPLEAIKSGLESGECPGNASAIIPVLHRELEHDVLHSMGRRLCISYHPISIISVQSAGMKNVLQPTPIFLPRKSHGQRSLVGYSPWGHKESDITKWLNSKSIKEWMVKKIKTKKKNKPQIIFKHVLCILSPCHVLSHLSFTVIPWSGHYYHHLGFTKEKMEA